MTCSECDRLWKVYEGAVFEHVRVTNKLKTAEASGDSEAIAALAGEAERAASARGASRQALLSHEQTSGHGEHLSNAEVPVREEGSKARTSDNSN